jgi:leader peptidase (prepilin peptidase)/N-methyltransferase
LPSWLVPLLVAPFIGSFLGVLIRRLPNDRSVVRGRSACESCGQTLAPLDLVPLLSFAALRGRCRTCRARIAPMHPAVELAALGVAAVCVRTQNGDIRIWAGCVLGWALLALAWIDWDHFRLPDALTLPLIPLGLLVTEAIEPQGIASHAVAAAIGYLAFRGIGEAYRWWRGREGLGQGDAKLMAAAGAWVGIDSLSDVLLGGSLLGLLFALGTSVRLRTLKRDHPVAFGPSLALATWLVWLASN